MFILNNLSHEMFTHYINCVKLCPVKIVGQAISQTVDKTKYNFEIRSKLLLVNKTHRAEIDMFC